MLILFDMRQYKRLLHIIKSAYIWTNNKICDFIICYCVLYRWANNRLL